MAKRGYVWVKKPEKIAFTAAEKDEFLKVAEDFISASKKLKAKVRRLIIRGSYLYMYEYLEVTHAEEDPRPLIDGKYLEWNYARITFKDKCGNICTADWQRANNQWLNFHTGTLRECLSYIEENSVWFDEAD